MWTSYNSTTDTFVWSRHVCQSTSVPVVDTEEQLGVTPNGEAQFSSAVRHDHMRDYKYLKNKYHKYYNYQI